MSRTARALAPLGLTIHLLVALVCVSAAASPARADDRRPTIIVVERAAKKMEKISTRTAAKIQATVDKTFDKVRAMAGSNVSQQRLFRIFQLRNRRLLILNFFSQQKLANIRESALKRLENLEPNPEASQMLEDMFTEAQGRLQSALTTNQSRLQNIFNVANETPPEEPNGLRGAPIDDDEPETDLDDLGDDDDL